MVVLKNIVKNKDTISCDYYPEGKEPAGHIVVDISSGNIISHDEAYITFWYVPHTVKRLNKLAKEIVVPENDLIMWY